MKTFALALTSIGMAFSLNCNAGPAAQDSAQHQRLAADEAYILVDMGARGEMRHYVSSLNFTDKGAGIKLSVPRERGLQLVKVKAGTFQPETFSVKSKRAAAPQKRLAKKYASEGIKVEAGTVTYIGNWHVRYGQRVDWLDDSYLVERADYSVHYTAKDVEKFYQDNQWISNYPLRVAHINGKRLASQWNFGS